MRRILITGLSGVGKSSVIAELRSRGYKAVDTDDGDYFEFVRSDDETRRRFGGETEWRWREERIAALLDEEGPGTLFVSGTSSNQARFYPRFDRIVLLVADEAVMARRMTARRNNPYGHGPGEVERQLELKPIVEPLLRRVADAVIDTTNVTLDEVVDAVLALGQ